MEIMNSEELNTPIKKIKNLSITSPDIKRVMVEKGYSNSISDKVLNEMNIKLNQSSHYGSSPMSDNEIHIDNVDIDEMDRMENQENKFNHIHTDYFNKMESIMNHYSIKRDTSELSNSKKKRRTLTGIEESPVMTQNFHHRSNSPYGQRGNPRGNPRGSHPVLSRTRLSPTKIPNMSLSTINNSFNSPHHLPPTGSLHDNSSPIHPRGNTNPSPSRISPSRKSYNLNEMLTRKISVPKSRSPSKDTASPTRASQDSNAFKHPRNFQKINPPSYPIPKLSNPPSLQKKSSIPTLNHSNLPKKPSVSSLNQGPSLSKKSSIPTLQKKSSIPTLNPSLQKKPSVPAINPALNKKSSIPTLNHNNFHSLQKKPSSASLSHRPSSTSLNKPTPSHSQHHTLASKPSQKHLNPSISRKASAPSFNTQKSVPSLHSSTSLSSLNSTKTYDKPTVSSSQKSLDKFSRFKTKFQ